MRPVPRSLALSVAIGLAGAAGAQMAPPHAAPRAGEPAASDAPPTDAAPAAVPTVVGRLQRWLVNPNGHVDGLLLTDGTQVNFPPHLAAEIAQAARPGDAVQAQGWRAPDAPVLRAHRLSAGGRIVEDAPPAHGNAPRPPAPGALAAMSAGGRVARLLYTSRGDANGVLLDNGAIVRFPPHVGAAMADALQPGSPVFARGWGTDGPQGSALEATALGPSEDRARELFAGPGVEPALVPRGGHPIRGPRGRHAPPPAAAPAPPQS